MKLLILIAVCACALSVPLDNQNDPLKELLQKVLEANPHENDIGRNAVTVDKQLVANNEDTQPKVQAFEDGAFTLSSEPEFNTEAAVTEGGDILYEIVELVTPKSNDFVITKETLKTNISEAESKDNNKITDEKIQESTDNQDLISTDEQTTMPSTELTDKVEGPFNFDEVNLPHTENQYDDSPFISQNQENNRQYDEDLVRIPLDKQENWNPNLYSHDTFGRDNMNIFEPINKDYEDHMTMLENPFLSPVDTLPLDPSLMHGALMNDHGHISPDYPFYDYMDETEANSGYDSNNTYNEDESVPREIILPEEDFALPDESNNDTVLIMSEIEVKPAEETQDVVIYDQTNPNDERLTLNTNEMNENHPSDTFNIRDKNYDALQNEDNELLDMPSPFQDSQNFDNHMQSLNNDALLHMNNEQLSYHNPSYGARSNLYDIYNQYTNMDDMQHFNPYAYHPHEFDDILYKTLLERENAYRMNQYLSQNNYYPDDSLSIFNTNANVDATTELNNVNYQGQTKDNLRMGSTFMQDNPGMLSENYNAGQESSLYSAADTDLTPMTGILPLIKQNPVVEIPQNSNSENSEFNNFNNREQDISLLLYNRLLQSLGKSQNNIMNPYVSNPLRKNVPIVMFVDSSKKNVDNDIANVDQLSEGEDQGNMMENAYTRDDGTLLTDIKHNVNLPYSPAYHPAFYPDYRYYNQNQYPYGYKNNMQHFDMTTNTSPYDSNIFNYPSQHSELGYYDRYYRRNQRNRHYYPYSDDFVNPYAYRNYYRRDPMSHLLQNYYYY